MPHHPVTVIGAGIAGSEAAWQLAVRGIPVTLLEMRPHRRSPAHGGSDFAELVCSNSFKGTDPSSATGTLKLELRSLGSLITSVAEETRVPAGAALAVDRDAFATEVTRRIESHPLIEVERTEACDIPEGDVILATGPLSSESIEQALSRLIGEDRLAFFDAAAPIIDGLTVDRSIAFPASRYDKGDGADYLNCPLDRTEYAALVEALTSAPRVHAHEFESGDLFQACQPVEEVARTGPDSLRFGALKPVGLVDPRTGERPWAVVQLRPENRARTAYNLVGFQTNLTFPAQRAVIGMIPGLAGAEILRFGVMHRNTFVDAPRTLAPDLSLIGHPRVRLAGQLTGTEGYLEAAASGLLAALNVAAALTGQPPVVLPRETAFGALVSYATDPATSPYQPMHVNWGLVPPLDPPVRGKRARYAAYAARAAASLATFRSSHPLLADAPSGPSRG